MDSAAFQPVTISTGIRSSAARTPDKVALSLGDSTMTYSRLVDRIDRVVGLATEVAGLRPGDHAALMAPNCLEYIEIVCGLADAGVATVMVNPRLTAYEAAYICNDSQAKVLFVHASLEELVRSAQLDTVRKIIVIGDDYERQLEAQRPAVDRPTLAETDIFALPYTAGTTGQPKGVMLPHRSRVLTFLAMAVEYGCYSLDDRSLAIAPLYHGAGFAFALAPVFFGGSCEILPKFEAEIALERLQTLGITNTFMVPTHFNAIFGLDREVLGKYNFPELKTIISNAAPLPQSTKEKIIAYFGSNVLHETYGSTEGGIVCNLRPVDQLRKIQSVGRAFPLTEVRLIGADGKDVAPGEVGELYSRSPFLFSGYWGRPEATAESFRGEWMTVGDLARFDDEGYIYLIDRKKDMIISGGVNIYPREIEEVLHAHPAIAEAAVIGIPDDYWGELVRAYVAFRRGEETSAEEVLAFCKTRLAGFKLPKQLEIVDALPRNAAGKVLKTKLRELAG